MNPDYHKVNREPAYREQNKTMELTAPQKQLLEELLIDCQLWTPRTQRDAYLTRVCNRPISHVDELKKAEASLIIGQLIARRKREREARSMEGEKGLFDDH